MKKKLKGFTLVEIIIALAIFSIMALIASFAISISSRMTMNSQATAAKANAHSYVAEYGWANNQVVDYDGNVSGDADVDLAVTPGTKDDVNTVSMTVNGVTLDKVECVELEGASGYKNTTSGYGDAYDGAPNIKFIRGSN